MRRMTQIGRGTQRVLGSTNRPRTAMRRGGLDGMRAPRGTDAFNVEFVMQAAACIDRTALDQWMAAIDARLGAPLPIAVYKLHTLAAWFSLDARSAALARSTGAEFRRFIGATLHGPVVDADLYWAHALARPRARDARAKLAAAVELQLIEHGFLAPAAALLRLEPEQVPASAPPLVLAHAAIPASPQCNGVRACEADAPPGAFTPNAGKASGRGKPVLTWPWGATKTLSDPLAVGRDGDFCDLARHLAADRKVSHKHARLTPVEAGVLAQDLGASNGTYVDDEPIPFATTRLVSSDACLRFGTDLAVMLTFVAER